MPDSPPPDFLRPWIPAERVRERIGELAEEVRGEARSGVLHLLHVEQGARRFADALAAHLAPALRVCRSALRAERSAGTRLLPVRVESADLSPLNGQEVLVVDDILDEGRTLEAVLARVEAARPASIRVAVLVRRQPITRDRPTAHHVGFEVERGWVVGFGMDLDGRFRERDDLRLMDPRDPP